MTAEAVLAPWEDGTEETALYEPPSRDDKQDECLECLFESLKMWDRVAVDWATGTGKTVVAAKFSRAWLEDGGRRVLFLVDTIDLVNQTLAKFARWGLRCDVERAEARAVLHDLEGPIEVIVGSRDTLKDGRLEGWPKDTFDLIFIDEAHLTPVDAYQRILRHFSGYKLVGLTGTLFRMDRVLLVNPPAGPADPIVYQAVAHRYRLKDGADGTPGAISNGHLSRILAVQCPLEFDLKGVNCKRKRGQVDFDPRAVEERVIPLIQPLANMVVDQCQKYGLDRVIVYAPDVRSSKLLAAAINGLEGRPMSAEAVWGRDPDRSEKLRRHQAGEFNIMVNNKMLMKGYDDEALQAVFCAMPIGSLVDFWQIVGRATRIHPSKRVGYVFGFRWDCEETGDVRSSVELFFADEPDAVRKAAEKLMGGRGRKPDAPVDLADMLAAAREKAAGDERKDEEKKGRRERRIRTKRERGTYRVKEWDPIKAKHVSKLQACEGTAAPGMATRDQMIRLAEMGVPKVGTYSEADAAGLLSEWGDRAMAGMSTYKQCAYLMRLGDDFGWAATLTSHEAARRIGQHKAGSVLRESF